MFSSRVDSKRPVVTLPNFSIRPATNEEWRLIEYKNGNVTHRLVRKDSDWSIVCGDCKAEFWAAGSSVLSPCPLFPMSFQSA
jgi:hypothetical protein